MPPSPGPTTDPTSPTPTVQVFDSEEVSTSAGVGTISRCPTPPGDTTNSVEREFSFTYSMLLEPTASGDQAVQDIEGLMHNKLAFRFFTCEFSSRRRLRDAFELEEMNSLPEDSISRTESCSAEQQQSGYDCYVVDGGFTTKL